MGAVVASEAEALSGGRPGIALGLDVRAHMVLLIGRAGVRRDRRRRAVRLPQRSPSWRCGCSS
ncbi:hypothetical protein HBB16_03485 [Pseudonocardia sp. MCCB 268]|nr:hypothetical protein [Pseudonocardia cytotoxica]